LKKKFLNFSIFVALFIKLKSCSSILDHIP
jgi:hypothetical protein